MSRTEMKPTWYAMYRGDTFIDLGTADYLADKYHKKKQSLLYLSKPAYHRKAPSRSKSSRSRRIMPDWIYAALFLAILALVILLVGGL